MKPVVLAVIAASLIGLLVVVTPNSASVPTHCVAQGQLPDPKCTPGSIYSKVTQKNIQATICKAGWTSTIRPPVSYTEPLKKKLMAAYGYHDSMTHYELDHLVPLSLGGDPTSVKNLWPESPATPNPKDGVEATLR